jgi:hypothetical protein
MYLIYRKPFRMGENTELIGYCLDKTEAIKYCNNQNKEFGEINNLDYCHMYYCNYIEELKLTSKK